MSESNETGVENRNTLKTYVRRFL